MSARRTRSAKSLKKKIVGLLVALAAAVIVGLITQMTGGPDAGEAHEGGGSAGSSTATTETGQYGTEEATRFVSAVDGDTIKTEDGTIRIVGIDTPERGECGYRDAGLAIERVLSPGDAVTLVFPRGQNAADRYGRKLSYVRTASGTDIGLMQLEAGLAVARYDSGDGYPKHPREAEYHAAQRAVFTADRTVQTTSCGAGSGAGAGGSAGGSTGSTSPAPAPTTAAPAPGAGAGSSASAGAGAGAGSADAWWTQYPSCSALGRNTVGHPKGPFYSEDPAEAAIYQWFAFGTGHNGDGDNDGLACE